MAALANPSTMELLDRWRTGDQAAFDALLPLVYEELRRIARRHLQGEPAGHTLQTTALVHEAYLRLVKQGPREAQQRAHFIAFASHVMRQILVDHARSRHAAKREGGIRVTIGDDSLASGSGAPQSDEIDVVAVDEALRKLSELDERQARIVELRYFGGLTIAEAAEVLGMSPATIKREWATARAWLLREMNLSRSPEVDRGRTI